MKYSNIQYETTIIYQQNKHAVQNNLITYNSANGGRIPKTRIFETLRHTFVTRCLESGMDLLTISKTHGHSSVKITGDVYLHMAQPHQKECLDWLDAVYF